MRLRIVLADEHPVLLDGLKSLLCRQGMDVVAAASNMERTIEFARRHRPDVAIISDSLLRGHGTEAAKEFRKVAPDTRIIVLGESGVESPELLSDGIAGYIEKAQHPDALLKAILQVSRGEVLWGPNRLDGVRRVRQPRLSPREREVLKLIAEGWSATEAAQFLGLSAKTIAAHRASLIKKLSIRDTATLVRYAIRSRIVDA